MDSSFIAQLRGSGSWLLINLIVMAWSADADFETLPYRLNSSIFLVLGLIYLTPFSLPWWYYLVPLGFFWQASFLFTHLCMITLGPLLFGPFLAGWAGVISAVWF